MRVHTAGQWEAVAWSRHAKTTVVAPDPFVVTGKRIVAECETEDDALLIAAAPELLVALQEAIETIEALSGKDNSCDPSIDCGEFRALIAKAAGAA